MRALITGGTGYVAGYLARRLLADGAVVRLTRRANTPPAASLGADAQWTEIADIGPDTDWRAALAGIDVVFHLAAVAHQMTASQAALAAEYERVNARGTEQLARSLLARGGSSRLVFLSSIGAVCTTSATVVNEATPPHPDSAYGRSKLLAERLLAEVCRNSPVQWCALRAPLVYGPGAPGNMNRLLGLADKRWPLPLGGARAPRSLLYVGNLVDALRTCATHEAVSARALLVADDETISVSGLVQLVSELRGHKARLLNVPAGWMKAAARCVDALRPGPADRNDRLAKSLELLFGSLVLDTSEIRRLTQWRPPYSLRAGMAATLADPEDRAA